MATWQPIEDTRYPQGQEVFVTFRDEDGRDPITVTRVIQQVYINPRGRMEIEVRSHFNGSGFQFVYPSQITFEREIY